MPNRSVHDFLTVATSVVLAPVTYSVLYSVPELREWAPSVAACVFVAHNLSGILFSPDLDMDTHIHKRWGMLFALWIPYQMVIPHRHFWSHGLVIPPLLRLGYFFWMLVGLVYLVERVAASFGLAVPALHQSVTAAFLALVVDHPVYTATVAGGFVSGAAVHSITDWLVSGGKKLLQTLFVAPGRRDVEKKGPPLAVPTRWLFDPFSGERPRHF